MSVVVNRKELGLRWKHEFGDFMEGEPTLTNTNQDFSKLNQKEIKFVFRLISEDLLY